MIARISGRLEEVNEGTALIDAGGGLWYELFIPACDVENLARRTGQDVILHTIHYMEGDPSHGAVTPRLIGFLAENDRKFFKVFTTVKGIGVKSALKALASPVAQIANAIQAKDAKLLQQLPGVGKRTAELIVAELNGKVDQFVSEGDASAAASVALPSVAEDAIAVLTQLGEKRPDAVALVERVMAVAPDLNSAEEIIQHVYKLKSAGR